MTANDAIWLSGMDKSGSQNDSADVLDQLKESALGLLAGLDRAPKSLRIKADQVEIELAWPEAEAVAVAPALALAPAPAASAAADQPRTAESAAGQFFLAHTVGVFYRSHEPGAKPFVEAGDLVSPGQQVGIIEAMKLMIPVEADAAAKIVEVLVADGAAVEYGDKLFAIEPIA